jgi:hypothetical protein
VAINDVFRWRRGPKPGFEATGIMPAVLGLLADRDERVDPRIFGSPAMGGFPEPANRSLTGGAASSGLAGPTVSASSEYGREAAMSSLASAWPGRARRLGTILE